MHGFGGGGDQSLVLYATVRTSARLHLRRPPLMDASFSDTVAYGRSMRRAISRCVRPSACSCRSVASSAGVQRRRGMAGSHRKKRQSRCRIRADASVPTHPWTPGEIPFAGSRAHGSVRAAARRHRLMRCCRVRPRGAHRRHGADSGRSSCTVRASMPELRAVGPSVSPRTVRGILPHADGPRRRRRGLGACVVVSGDLTRLGLASRTPCGVSPSRQMGSSAGF